MTTPDETGSVVIEGQLTIHDAIDEPTPETTDNSPEPGAETPSQDPNFDPNAGVEL